jgi:hypothetical protein
MKTVVICVLATMVLTPIAALADDASYCAALSKLYREVSTGTTSAAAAEAMNQCSQGNYAGIPVLEKALTDAKVSLPAR